MSRSWPRVISPTPGRSILITSAPNHASSCVQVGPDCTWVKSRMRTPSSALPASPNGLLVGRGRPFDPAALADLAGFFDFNFTTFFAAVLDFALDLLFAVLGFLVVIVDLRDLR